MVPATPPEDEELSREHIGRQLHLHQRAEPIDPAAHIRESRHQPDANPGRYAQHGPDSSRKIACSRSVPNPPQILRRVPLGNSISTR